MLFINSGKQIINSGKRLIKTLLRITGLYYGNPGGMRQRLHHLSQPILLFCKNPVFVSPISIAILQWIFWNKINLVFTCNAASSVKKNSVAPDSIHLADFFAPSQYAETKILVYFQACCVFGKDARLQRPEALLFTSFNKFLKQFFTDALTLRWWINIYADFADTCIHASARNRCNSGLA